MGDADWPSTATVEVWVAPLLVPPPVLASLVTGLTAAERARAARYRAADDARRFSMARGWLRAVLAAALGTTPADVPLVDGPGKPRLAAGPCFNLSHAGELALIAVAAGEVGVDVEPVDRGRGALGAVPVACSPAEVVGLDRLPPGERAEAFLRRWTAKEAYLKATGQGLGLAPDRVEVGAAGSGSAAPVRVIGDAGPARWWVRELRPAPGYVGAVAAEGRDWTVVLRSTAQLGL